MRGRKPKPNALKILQGNPGKRKLKPEPKGTPAPIDAPPPKGMPAAAREYWKKYYPLLHSFGVLQETDLPAFESLCRAWANYKKADNECNKPGGMVQTSESGFKSVSVWAMLRKQYQTEVKQMWEQFGLTPSSRTRVKLSPPPNPGLFGDISQQQSDQPPRSELEELLGGGGGVIGRIGA